MKFLFILKKKNIIIIKFLFILKSSLHLLQLQYVESSWTIQIVLDRLKILYEANEN